VVNVQYSTENEMSIEENDKEKTQKGAHRAACARKRAHEGKRMTTYTLTHTKAFRRRKRRRTNKSQYVQQYNEIKAMSKT